MADLYKSLQVDPRAEIEVIRAAYHALARKYHPDVGGDAQRMVQCNAAWAVLANPLLRAAYDAERNGPNAPLPAPEAAEACHRSEQCPGDTPPRRMHDSSSIVDFGRYAGWSLEQLVAKDPNYLEWLVRTPIGRHLSPEIRTLLDLGVGSHRPNRGSPLGERRERTPAGRGWFRRTNQAR